MEAADVVDDVVDELARVVGVDRGTLMRDLEDAGADWPYDSVVLVEVMVAVEQQLGIRVPMDADTVRALRSVTGLSERLAELSPKGPRCE